MARAGGLIPEPDMKTPRWSGPVVDALVARREQLLADLPDYATANELMDALGLEYGDWRRGLDAGVIAASDQGEYWSRPLVQDLQARAEEIRASIPPQPLGIRRCVELLHELTRLRIEESDIEDLAEQGLISVVDWYKDWPLYDVAALRDVVADERKRAVLEQIYSTRMAWLANSISASLAAESLEFSEDELQRAATHKGLTPGRFGRYTREQVMLITEDEDLREQITGERLLGPERAAQHLEIRRIDFDYLVAAGWFRRSAWGESHVSARKVVRVPLYRVAALRTARQIPGIDWEALHALQPGEPSPLKEFARLPIARATLVRGFIADLAARHGIRAGAFYDDRHDIWELEWLTDEDGNPDEDTVWATLRSDPDLALHARAISMHAATSPDDLRHDLTDLEEP
jgi:hypothetical protein